MFIEVVTVGFYLENCHSLKQKRQALSGLRDKYGKIPTVAVVETDYQEQHQQSQWQFVFCGMDQKLIDKGVAQLERTVSLELDARVVQFEREKI